MTRQHANHGASRPGHGRGAGGVPVLVGAMVFALACSGVSGQFQSVVDSPHNLSAFGPGSVRAVSENQVCIFCHTPHNSTPVRPLWNRSMPVDAYSIYTSRSLDAKPGQPTGTSKMCLSCHDGTIAIGSVSSRQTPIAMIGGVTTMPAGRGLIGTDLSDDHPISFRYDSALAAADPKLRHPAMLPHEIRLDANGELQCTTCHNAHNNVHGNFLVMSNIGSQLCVQCHQMGQTNIPQHQDCASCHVTHGSPSGPYLLKAETVGQTCLSCHDGLHGGGQNIASQVMMPYSHETFSPVDPPDPQNTHVSCADCHEPHTMMSSVTQAPNVPGNFGRIGGVSSSGSPVIEASYEYEVCFKCHANNNPVQPRVSRVIVQNNTRLEFDPSAISYHPIAAPGRNPNVPSLKPGWNESSLVRCADCHGAPAGGSGPHGVHGSVHAGMLVANYSTADFTVESPQAYALCYMCHDRNSILNDESFSGHRRHIVDQRTSCATCHDSHGIASFQGSMTRNSHLMNFDTSVVSPDPGTGRLEFIDRGVLSGTCYLRCHGVNHSPFDYP